MTLYQSIIMKKRTVYCSHDSVKLIYLKHQLIPCGLLTSSGNAAQSGLKVQVRGRDVLFIINLLEVPV